jgi:hypothetical protein
MKKTARLALFRVSYIIMMFTAAVFSVVELLREKGLHDYYDPVPLCTFIVLTITFFSIDKRLRTRH